MARHALPYAIVALGANVTHDDPDEFVGSNVWFLSSLISPPTQSPAIRDGDLHPSRPAMSSYLRHATTRHRIALIALPLIAALSACAAGQDKDPPAKSAQQSNSASNELKATAAKGETVRELDKAIFYIFQAKDNTYWFGSNERGVYRYDGKALVNFTKKDGLVSNQIRGIQEDKAGNIYFTTYEGINRFDGRAFTTLNVSPSSDWTKQPDDLWFVGTQDTGVVYRYDGKSLLRLASLKPKSVRSRPPDSHARNSQTRSSALMTFTPS